MESVVKVENVILSNLLSNEDYVRQVLPHIKQEYFHDEVERYIFNLIESYTHKFNSAPPKEALLIELNNSTGLSDMQFSLAVETIDKLNPNKAKNNEWLISETEKFCQDKAIYNAIMESIKIMNNDSKTQNKGSIPVLLSDALSVSFDTSIGHDFIEDSAARYDFYHKKENKLSFDLEFLNKITNGGLSNKTLNVILAGCVHPETKVRVRFRKIA